MNDHKNDKIEFSIYRICSSKQAMNKCKDDDIKYSFNTREFFIGDNYAEFINKIITGCKEDYALVCNDDIFFPINIQKQIGKCVENADNEFGNNKWGIIGNFGVEVFSNKILHYLKNGDSSLISPSSIKSRVVISIDSNTILLNIKNLKSSGVKFPGISTTRSFYANILLYEVYLKKLLVLVDSNLYVLQKGFNSENISVDINSEEFKEFKAFFSSRFINNSIITTTGEFKIENDLSYLKKNSNDKRIDLYSHAENLLLRYSDKKIKLNILIRTMLNRQEYLKRSLDLINVAHLFFRDRVDITVILSINNATMDNIEIEKVLQSLKCKYDNLNITHVINEAESNLYPRVLAIFQGLLQIKENDSFVWIVDDDDFIFPDSLKYLIKFLDSRYVLIGNSIAFDEIWGKDGHSFPDYSKKKMVMKGERYFNIVKGDNNIPICSVIYPTEVIKNIFSKYSFEGDYYEDYEILLISLKEVQSLFYPITMAGVSFHGKNTVLEKDRTHWHYNYATVMSEIVNNNVIDNWTYEFISELNISTQKKDTVKTITIKNGLSLKFAHKILKFIYNFNYNEVILKAYKTLEKKGFKKTLGYAYKYLKHGRDYFKDGIDTLDDEK